MEGHKKAWGAKAECRKCNGSGLYVGMAEHGGDAVGLALGWATETNENTGVRYWRRCDANPRPNGHWRSEDMRIPLDFTGRDKWAALGEVWEECERRGWTYGADSGECWIRADGGFPQIEPVETYNDIPTAAARAFIRAVAGEGRA